MRPSREQAAVAERLHTLLAQQRIEASPIDVVQLLARPAPGSARST